MVIYGLDELIKTTALLKGVARGINRSMQPYLWAGLFGDRHDFYCLDRDSGSGPFLPA